MDACLTTYPLPFGSFIKTMRGEETAKGCAAKWLSEWEKGEIYHDNVKISACNIEFDGSSPTGLKVFDEARNRSSPLSTGNVFSNVQSSTYVSSFHKTDNSVRNKGDYQNYGLKIIQALNACGGDAIVEFIRNVPSINDPLQPDKSVIAYLIHHYHGPKSDPKRLDHGWIVTDNEGALLKRLHLSKAISSQRIMDMATDILTLKRSNEVLLLQMVDKEIQFVDPEVRKLADAAAAAAEKRLYSNASVDDDDARQHPRMR